MYKILSNNISLTNLFTWFERASMLVILLNCVTLGMYQPCVDDQCISRRCRILQVIYFFFFKLHILCNNNIRQLSTGVRRLHIRILFARNDRENDCNGSVRSLYLPRRLLEQIRFFHRDRRVRIHTLINCCYLFLFRFVLYMRARG